LQLICGDRHLLCRQRAVGAERAGIQRQRVIRQQAAGIVERRDVAAEIHPVDLAAVYQRLAAQ